MPFIIIGALIIGLMLGLMGSGGSILTVPVLVYVLGHDGKVAIAESLAIVGGIALVSLLPYARSHLVNWRNVLFFGIPGMAGTYLGAWSSHYVASTVQLTLFAVVMLIAAVLMLRRGNVSELPVEDTETEVKNRPVELLTQQSIWLMGLEGVIVGIITGLVGVGGGFLIVPALVVFGKLPMRVAIGTSLAVIAMKSLSGFYKYLDVLESLGESVDWSTVGMFVAIGILGSLVGHSVATRMNQDVLRLTFAVFLIGMGLFVLGKEGPKLLNTSPANNVARSGYGRLMLAEVVYDKNPQETFSIDQSKGTVEHADAEKVPPTAVVLERDAEWLDVNATKRNSIITRLHLDRITGIRK